MNESEREGMGWRHRQRYRLKDMERKRGRDKRRYRQKGRDKKNSSHIHSAWGRAISCTTFTGSKAKRWRILQRLIRSPEVCQWALCLLAMQRRELGLVCLLQKGKLEEFG